MQLVFLGSGDEEGVPRAGCDCQVCRNVLSRGNRNYRTPASVVLHYGPSYAQRVLLIDTAPEFRLQATSLGLQQFDALLLTHAHDAHILGLSILVGAQRRTGRPLTVCAPAQVLEDVRERFGTLWTDKAYRRVWQPRAIEGTTNLWGLDVRPLRVNHGIGGTAHGYLLSDGELRVAYIADMLQASDDVRQALSELDLLVLGASHYYEGIETWKRSVMDVVAALELIQEVAPKRAILTHLSHTIEYDEVSARLPSRISLAYDGLAVEVGS